MKKYKVSGLEILYSLLYFCFFGRESKISGGFGGLYIETIQQKGHFGKSGDTGWKGCRQFS